MVVAKTKAPENEDLRPKTRKLRPPYFLYFCPFVHLCDQRPFIFPNLVPISTVFTFVWFSFLINCGLKKSPQPSLHAISRKWKEAVLRNTQFSLWCQKKSSDRRKLVTIFFWPRSHHCLTQRSSHGRPCITTQADVWVKKSQNYYLRAKPWMRTLIPGFPYVI